MPPRAKPKDAHLTRAQHRERALHAARLRAGKSKLTWQQIADRLGYSNAQTASRAVRRHTNPAHPNAVKHIKEPQSAPPVEPPAGEQRAIEAGALRVVGLTWQQIADRLNYPSAAAASSAWARHRHQLPPREYADTKSDRWENLFRRNMGALSDALTAPTPDLASARAHLALAQSLLATQPPPTWDTAEIAGAALAAHFADAS